VNPDLVKAARAIVAARKMHPDLTADEVEQIAKSYGHTGDDVVGYIQKLRGDHGDLVASGLKGFTANWGDELVGLLPEKLGGGEYGKEEMRLRQELASIDHPVAAPATEIAGGIGSAVLTGGLSPEFQGASRVANAAKTAAVVGGGYGAVAGAGEGENLQDRARGAAVGGATGAVLGGALGAGTARVIEHTSTAAALLRQLDAIEQSGGFQRLQRSLEAFRHAGRGDEVIMADLSHPLQNAADFAANNNPRVYSKAAKILNDRQPDITERLLTDVEDHVGKPLPDAVKRAAQLKDEKYDWANSAYSNLRKDIRANFSHEDISGFVDKPTIEHALSQAQLADDISQGGGMQKLLEGLKDRISAGSRDPKDIAMLKQIANTGSLKRPLTFTDMQSLKRALDGKVGAAYAKGNVPLADAYKAVRDQVHSAILAKVPEYAAVDAEYAAKSRLQEMLTHGVSTWNKIGVRDLEADLAALPAQEREVFRYGLASKLVDTLRDTNTNRNVAKQIMDKGISMQEKLKVVFGDAKTFDKFMERVHAERTMGETRGVIGGSATHKRDSDAMFNPLPALAGIAYGPHGVVSSLLHHIVGSAGKRESAAVAEKMGANLFTQGADKVDALLAKLASPVNILSHRSATSIGQGSGILTSSLFGN
jgi:hypothetical protein